MKKKSIIATGVVAAAAVTLPFAGNALAITSTVNDTVNVNIGEACTIDSSSTTAGSTTTNNTYSVTMTNSQLKSDIGNGSGTNSLSVQCNSSTTTWGLTAVGAGTGANVSQMTPAGSGSTPIATGTETSGNASKWAFKVAGATGLNIQGGYDQFSAVPTTSTTIATGTGTKAAAFTLNYQVWISATQEADTYTGKVTYTLTSPRT